MKRNPQALLTFQENAVVLVCGVGLMGQHAAQYLLNGMNISKLVLVDANETIKVSGKDLALQSFADGLDNPDGAEIVTYVADVTDETTIAALFKEHQGFDYLIVTTGISPMPLTPPTELNHEFASKLLDVNTWGPVNVVDSAVREGALKSSAKAVIMLSTAANNGAEGRANVWYEASKAALKGWLEKQAWHYASAHGLVLNGISPNPLVGPMASGNPVSRRRVAAVERNTPMGLCVPLNISASIAFFLAKECNCCGQDLVVDGGYCGSHAIYGDLPVEGSAVEDILAGDRDK
jgi:NAD(P)-dependent dehydrogenase (short-subunit alcohol dehydrogenase family)